MAEPSVNEITNIAAYFLLISITSKGRDQSDHDADVAKRAITDVIRNVYKGSCKLFRVPGPYDFISMVEGVSEAQAIQIQQQIEVGGYVKALLLPGVRDTSFK